jgi:hypothetical protein
VVSGRNRLYEAPEDWTGVDTLTYQICATNGTCVEAPARVTVTP